MKRDSKSKIVMIVGVFVLGGTLYIGTAINKNASPATPRNLLFIVMDALRAESLSLYGYPLKTSPHLDQFAKKSVVFERAWAQGTYTLASYLSYMTSVHVRTHRWDFPIGKSNSEKQSQKQKDFYKAGICGRNDLITLAEALSARGFDATALVGNTFLEPKKGYPRGFRMWNNLVVKKLKNKRLTKQNILKLSDYRIAKLTHQAMSKWKRNERHFLYLHLMSPHLPTRPSKNARIRFDLPKQPKAFVPQDVRRIEKDGSPAERALSKRYYHASIWDGDRILQHIFTSLEKLNLMKDTIVVFASDHGEKIWEHGTYGHVDRVWKQLVQVPLVVYAPNLKPARIKRPVALLDIAPTVFRLLGLGNPPERWQGGDLFKPSPSAIIVSERLGETALTVDGKHKAIRSPTNEYTFYDLKSDPREQRPIQDHKLQKQLQMKYHNFATRTKKVKIPANIRPVGFCGNLNKEEHRAQIEALRALGYIDD